MPRRIPLIAVISCLLLALLLAACENRRASRLQNTLNQYHSAIRWGDIGQAWAFVAPEYRTQHPLSELDLSRYAQVRVAGYDELEGPVQTGPDEARQTVGISLINQHTQRERSIIDEQVWRWDAAAGRWWLVSGLPDITPQD